MAILKCMIEFVDRCWDAYELYCLIGIIITTSKPLVSLVIMLLLLLL